MGSHHPTLMRGVLSLSAWLFRRWGGTRGTQWRGRRSAARTWQ